MSYPEISMARRESIPTINDIAELAGVSKRTVSRVINNSVDVSAYTREKVESIISDTNYAPDSRARGLAARRSYLIGLIYDVPTLFMNDVQKAILEVCTHEGYDIVVHPCEIGSADLIDDVHRFVSRSRVDGVIMLPPVSQIPQLAAALETFDIPYIRFDSALSAEPWRLVVTNYSPAVTDMTNFLVNLGHREIGFISGPNANISSRKREQAFAEALRRHGLEVHKSHRVEGAFTYESGVDAANILLKMDNRPTAIFAANDEMAFAVLNVADSLGIRVPEDLSVVGFDGTKFAEFMIPALSTIRRPTAQMARLGAQKLLAFIDKGENAAREFESMVSPIFVPRESTGPAPVS